LPQIISAKDSYLDTDELMPLSSRAYCFNSAGHQFLETISEVVFFILDVKEDELLHRAITPNRI
jgi:hypothetical protein